MSYDPNALPRSWHPTHPTQPQATIYPVRIDTIRLARLAILLGLAGFWALVFMVLF